VKEKAEICWARGKKLCERWSMESRWSGR